jgi:predicted transcriptional regulator
MNENRAGATPDAEPSDAPADDDAERRQQLARTLARGGMTDVLVLSHESAERVLTGKRRELVRVLDREPVESVRDLARRADRDKAQVSRDLAVLAEHGVVDFDTDGRAKRPFLQHEHVVVEPIL